MKKKEAKKLSKRQLRKLQRKTRHLSIKEAAFAMIKNSLGNSYVVPFAIAINASNSLVALLTSFAGLLGPISQLKSSKLIDKKFN